MKWLTESRVQQTFPVEVHIVNILGYEGQSVKTTFICYCCMQAARDDI